MIPTAESYNFKRNKFSNPDSKVIQFDYRISSEEKTSYEASQQKTKYSLGVYNSRQLLENNMRVSPNGLVPSAVRPNKGMVWQYNGAEHSFGNIFDPNLKRNQRY